MQFLPEDHPLLEIESQIYSDFSLTKNAPILVTIKDEKQSWLQKEKIDSLRKVVNQISQLEDVESVHSLANIESASEEGDDIAMGGLLELTDPVGWKDRVTKDPMLYPLFISKNLDTAVVFIMTSRARSGLMGLISSIRKNFQENYPNLKVQVGGVPTLQAQMAELIGKELKLFLFLALLTACLSLLLVFKSLLSILFPFVAILLSTLLSLEFMVLAGLSFNALSATMTVLVTIIVVAMCIHTQLRFCKQIESSDQSSVALQETFHHLFMPNMLTALTTAVGFLTLYFSPAPLIRQYGVSVAVSVFIAWLVTTAFLFGFLEKAPLPRARKWVFGQSNLIAGFVDHRKWVVAGVLLFSVLCLFFGRNLSWESRLFDDLPRKHEARSVTEYVDKNLGGLIPLDVSITAEEEGFWNSPEALSKLDELEKKWRDIESVGSVISLPELIRQAKNDPDMAILQDRKKIAEINFMFSLAEKNPLENFMTADGYSLRVSLRLQDIPASQMEKIVRDIREDVEKAFPQQKVLLGGLATYAHSLSRYLSESLMVGFWWALLAICVVLCFVFRSVTWMLVATVPNFLPAIGLLGVLGLSQLPVKPAIATIFSIALGIAFDNTVYILSRLKSYKSSVGQKLVKKAIKEEWISCFISSLSLFCGFAIFLMSYFSINRYFGLFLLFSILVGLVGDLLFLPAVLASLPENIRKRLRE